MKLGKKASCLRVKGKEDYVDRIGFRSKVRSDFAIGGRVPFVLKHVLMRKLAEGAPDLEAAKKERGRGVSEPLRKINETLRRYSY